MEASRAHAYVEGSNCSELMCASRVTVRPRPPQPSTCVEVDLLCGSKVRFGADMGAELVVEIIAAVRSRR
jgi:hypothetical protein